MFIKSIYLAISIKNNGQKFPYTIVTEKHIIAQLHNARDVTQISDVTGEEQIPSVKMSFSLVNLILVQPWVYLSMSTLKVVHLA